MAFLGPSAFLAAGMVAAGLCLFVRRVVGVKRTLEAGELFEISVESMQETGMDTTKQRSGERDGAARRVRGGRAGCLYIGRGKERNQ